MTPTVAQVVQRRGARARPTCISEALGALRDLHALESGIQWPSTKYQKDPVGFAHNVIGQGTWEAQDEILEAVRDHDRVSVRSGHKIGKSNTAGILAWWFFSSFTDARVVLTSVTARQVDAVLWREVRKMRARAGRCLDCKVADAGRSEEQRRRFPAPVPCPHSSLMDAGRMPDLARSGFRADDLREIVGFTAREAEAVAGVSGENILYEADEASGIEDLIFEAIDGNRAGGAKIILFSNPTRNEGEFFESHHTKALRVDARGKTVGFYKTVHVSSEDTPNVREGRKVIPGLATREWVEEKKREWGVDSALYQVRVKGNFVLNEAGKILSLHALTLAEARWDDIEPGLEDRLYIGLDPAGPADGGDDSVFAPRRGLKVYPLHIPTQGLEAEQHVTELLAVIKAHRRHRDVPPVVNIDRDGPIGSEIYGLLRAYADNHPHAFVVVGVRGSDRARREPDIYDRQRDELWANAAACVKAGVGLPEDARLTKELHTPSWFQPVGSAKIKATSKKELRRLLDGRSPDRADAVVLSLWEGGGAAEDAAAREADGDDDAVTAEAQGANDDDDHDGGADRTFDPYGGAG